MIGKADLRLWDALTVAMLVVFTPDATLSFCVAFEQKHSYVLAATTHSYNFARSGWRLGLGAYSFPNTFSNRGPNASPDAYPAPNTTAAHTQPYPCACCWKSSQVRLYNQKRSSRA